MRSSIVVLFLFVIQGFTLADSGPLIDNVLSHMRSSEQIVDQAFIKQLDDFQLQTSEKPLIQIHLVDNQKGIHRLDIWFSIEGQSILLQAIVELGDSKSQFRLLEYKVKGLPSNPESMGRPVGAGRSQGGVGVGSRARGGVGVGSRTRED